MFRRSDFPFVRAGEFAAHLIETVYDRQNVHPAISAEIEPLPRVGEGIDGFEDALQTMVDAGAGLASPLMAGHMDTAPHPAAAFADAVVSALNNNLLFRELSPFASRVEEMLVHEFAEALGMTSDWHGTFVSGGSLANLTALFAATGGYPNVRRRSECALFVSGCAHASVFKSAAVLGIDPLQVYTVESDEQGRACPDALATALVESEASIKIVVAVLGSTVHGAVENLEVLSRLAHAHNAWLHVDAIYGGALAYSTRYRHLLQGLNLADSVVLGPQKWMYVPRLSAVVWVKGKTRFSTALGLTQSYSGTTDNESDHRGQWGLQGSRRADALTLWAVLRCIGTNEVGAQVDRAIELTQSFHAMLSADDVLQPLHQPDLNLLCFNYRAQSAPQLEQMQSKLGNDGLPWVSVSLWESQPLFRSVLLAPESTTTHLQTLIDALRAS